MKHSLIFISALFSLSALGKEDASIYVTALQNEAIEKNILESSVFTECKNTLSQGQDLTSEKGKNAVRDCVSKKLQDVDDKKVEEFSSALGFKETKNSKSLREYLNKRIFDAIHGEGAYEKKELKKLKFVDQKLFLNLYKTQISKNLILEISKYCLENVGIAGQPGAFVTRVSPDQQSAQLAEAAKNEGKNKKSFDIALKGIIDAKEARLTLFYQEAVDTKTQEWSPLESFPAEKALSMASAGDAGEFWAKIQEYKYCPVVKTDAASKGDPCHKSRARNQQQIQALKNQELKWAQADANRIQYKYLTCSNFIIKNMCELYRCNNIYREGARSILYNRPAAKVCRALGASISGQASGDVSLENSSSDTRGQIACNLLERVEGYKKTFASIDEAEKKMDGLGKATGVELETVFSDEYKGENIDDITSISSKELVDNVSSFEENKKEAKELKEKCFQDGEFLANDPDCAELAGELDGSDLAKIQLDTEAETALYLERLKKLKGGERKEELKEYLIENGLHDYIPMLEDNTITADTLVQLISDKYKADRQALINNMNERFHALTKKVENGKGEDEQGQKDAAKEIAKDQVEEIEQHKDRLETIFNYSNIVSSYLQAKDEEGNLSQNIRARQIELDSLKDSDDKEEVEVYEDYFSTAEKSQGNATLSAQGQFIDDILGLGAKD